MKEEKRISYGAGVTRKPSDFLCGDGELAECINLTSDGEELKVMVPLAEKGNMESKKLVFVHKLGNGTENYIYEYNGGLLWATASISGAASISGSGHVAPINTDQIKAIGKTMVVSMDDELHYFLFKDSSYVHIGSNIPRPVMEFGLLGEPGMKIEQVLPTHTWSDFYYIGVGEVKGVDAADGWQITDKELYNDSVKGLYAEGKKKAAQQKAFVLPFFVRYALKLYDGSYTHISNPIPLFPNSSTPCVWYHAGFYVHAMYLMYTNKQTYNDWTDIVKGISIFVSKGTELVDTTIDAIWGTIGEHDEGTPVKWDVYLPKGETLRSLIYPFTMYTDAELSDDLCSESVFYHLCDISATEQKNSWTHLKDHFSHATLENITTQEQLPYDNFYSLAPLSAGFLYDYNNRMNLARVKRGFFAGFTSFSGLYDQPQHTYTIYVRIASESGTRVVYASTDTTTELIGYYFFYPDPRANHVTIFDGVDLILDEDLIEHPGLNGAYYWGGWPDYLAPGFSTLSTTPVLTYSDVYTNPEELFSFIVTSEVNNPFVYLAHGYNRVGTGYVIGMATQTQALSQGQFGSYPLMVFTTEGIWAMAVDFDGLYSRISPMSREVALKSNPAITTVDGAVFFVSKKGLMVIEGSKVSCVSERMDGKAFATDGTQVEGQGLPSSIGSLGQDISECSDSTTFHQFLLSASLRIAYDYIDSRLLLTNSTKGYCWVYSLKTGSFSKMPVPAIHNVVNAYPDYLLQNTTTYKVYTLYGKTREDEATTRQKGFLLTRPIKLGGVLTVASLRELVNVGYWEEGTNMSWVKTMILISDDLVHWYESKSRFGVAAKYFRIALFVNMLPTERLSGTIVREQERRGDNLR